MAIFLSYVRSPLMGFCLCVILFSFAYFIPTLIIITVYTIHLFLLVWFCYVRSLNERRIKQLTCIINFGKTFFYFYSQFIDLAACRQSAFCNICFRKQYFLINKALVIVTYCVCRLVFFSLESLSSSRIPFQFINLTACRQSAFCNIYFWRQ